MVRKLTKTPFMSVLHLLMKLIDFDLCRDCYDKPNLGIRDADDASHHYSHPLLKIPRPIIRIIEKDRNDFKSVAYRLEKEYGFTGPSEGSSGQRFYLRMLNAQNE